MRAPFLAAFLILAACGSSVESQFMLASDSRLPKWVTLPKGVRRDEVSVELTFYATADPRVEVARDGWPFKRTVQKNIAKRLGGDAGPRKLTVSTSDPRYDFTYDVLVVDGVVDIVEHPCSCPDFRMSDDPDAWAELATDSAGRAKK